MRAHFTQLLPALSVIAMLCGACSQDTGGGEKIEGLMASMGEDRYSPQGYERQGFEQQGFEQQGFEQQGFEQQGTDLKGFQLQSFKLQGSALQSVSLNGTLFTGTTGNGGTVSGTDFIGATVDALFQDGTPLTMRIDAIEVSPSDPDIHLYTVSWSDGAAWKKLCGVEDGAPITAIPLSGRWDLSQGTPTGGDHIDDPGLFTFGCSSAVLAKCALLGYKPWQSVEECASGGAPCHSISLRHLHQACTRMMRADACGDGTPHTTNGTLINVWDNQNIQTQAQSTWTLEAEWTPEGATCMKHIRWTSGGAAAVQATESYIDAHCPLVRQAPTLMLCGTSASSFSTVSGYLIQPQSRVFLRNESEAPPPPGSP